MSVQDYPNPYKAPKVDFLIAYEHKAREIEAICLIKIELERRGYSVGLSNTYDEQRVRFVERRRAAVVLTPALYSDASLFAFVYRVAGACTKVVNLQWEQALTNQDESDPEFYQNPKGLARQAVHLCWGEEPRRRMIASGVRPDRAVVVGPVQMDVLRQEMRGFYQSKAQIGFEFDLDPAREWALFISSFTFTNMPAEEFETELGCVGDWLLEFRSISVISQTEILAWVKAACAQFPDRIFIYRPHPSETTDPKLNGLADEFENFRVIAERPVRQWIHVSDRIFTWYSTSAAEVYFSGKTCSVLRPVEIPLAIDVSIFRNARTLRTMGEFRHALESPQPPFSLDVDLLRRYFDVDAATPTYIKICDLLEEVHKSDKYDMPSIGPTRAAYYFLQWVRHRVLFVLKEILAGHDRSSLVRRIGWIARKVDNHEALMSRMNADREKNLASVAELRSMSARLDEIRFGEDEKAGDLEACLSS